MMLDNQLKARVPPFGFAGRSVIGDSSD